MVPSGPFTVVPLTAVNSTPTDDHSPEISADGTALYFTTNRLGNFDIYRSIQSGGAWQPPERVDELSTTSSEGDVAISPDLRTAVIARSSRFYRATRGSATAPWDTPVLLAETFGSNYDAPALNGNLDIYHHANGADRDLFVARRNATGFDTTAPITELLTEGRDASPFVSADDRHLMFDCNRDICESSR
jgi:Tol biopolymer transport system component